MTAPNSRERILPRLIEEEMQQSFINYSMSVIVSRALPDVRDGLKPVHRRILYAMNELGLVPGRPYKKSATVVGDVLGKYHPHGDSSVYDALVRMVQDFSLRYPLVDGQGNFGSVDGDPAAAYRYTEARLTRVAVAMLEDIDKNTVNFQPNFDDRLQEPTVLPSKIPNLLVNGSSGIAVGMATNIPPHNLREVAKAVRAAGRQPRRHHRRPAEAHQGARLPHRRPTSTAARASRRPTRPAAAGSSCGPGRRSRRRSRSGRSQIVITEIPYQVNKENLVKAIAELAMEKKIEGISGVNDESDKDGMRLVIELKRDAIPNVVLNQLYKHTADAVHLRRDHAGAGQRRAQGHEPEGAARALHRAPARDHRPAHPVRPRRGRGAGAHPRGPQDRRRQHRRGDQDHPGVGGHARGRRAAPQAVRASARSRPTRSSTCGSPSSPASRSRSWRPSSRRCGPRSRSSRASWRPSPSGWPSSRRRWTRSPSSFGDDRRTEILRDQGEFTVEDLIAEEDMVITISHTGYIKRIPVTTYKRQRRGGRGLNGADLKADDWVEHLFIASTHDYLMFFTNTGPGLLAQGARDSRRPAARRGASRWSTASRSSRTSRSRRWCRCASSPTTSGSSSPPARAR